MEIHKQGITFVLLLLIFTNCSRKPSLQWIPFSWEGDTISGIYIEKAFLNVPVKIENLPYEFTMQFDLGAYNSVFYGNTLLLISKKPIFNEQKINGCIRMSTCK